MIDYEGEHLKRALHVGIVVAVIVVGSIFFLTRGAPRRPPHPRLIQVECIQVERGPTLTFANGAVRRNGSIVGSYRFKEASPGKYGPSIAVENIHVSEADGRVQVQPGRQGWFWFFIDDDTLEMVASGHIVRGRRCGALT
jgi:hypothetical protein